MEIRRAICIINYHKQKSREIAKITIEYLNSKGVVLLAPQGELGFSAHDLSFLSDFLNRYEQEGQKPDIAFIFGGDGTIIHAASALAFFGIPLMGVNLGKLGFLTAVEPANIEAELEKLMLGQFILEKRMLLWGEVIRDGQVIMSSSAQNDIVVNNSSTSRTIEIGLRIDGEMALIFNGDGLVLATPTGSTAYSLSAGGPIVLPNSNLIVATPISPHNLYVRPIIANENSLIQVACNFQNKLAQVTFDGQHHFPLQNGDEVVVKKSKYFTSFVWIEKSKFLTNLHRKMCCGI